MKICGSVKRPTESVVGEGDRVERDVIKGSESVKRAQLYDSTTPYALKARIGNSVQEVAGKLGGSLWRWALLTNGG